MASRNELSLATLSIGGVKIPRRPGYGTVGKKVLLRTNYFQVLPAANTELYQYSVQVNPEPNVARKRKRAFEMLFQVNPFLGGPAVATDNRSTIITTQKLAFPGDTFQHSIVYYEAEETTPGPKAKSHAFKIDFVKTWTLQEMMSYLASTNGNAVFDDKEAVLQALNIIMARKPSLAQNVAAAKSGNKFFPLDQELRNLGRGLIALRGYYTSVRTATLRLLVNVNSITGTFYQPGPLTDLMDSFTYNLRGPVQVQLHKFLKGLRVEVKHLKSSTGPPKIKTICGLALKPSLGATAKQVTFYWTDKKREVTVEQYFKQQHQITLAHTRYWVVNLGNAEHPMITPAELCNVIPGQMARQKLDPEQTAQMIRVAVRKPSKNARLIVDEGAKVMGLGQNVPDGPVSMP